MTIILFNFLSLFSFFSSVRPVLFKGIIRHLKTFIYDYHIYEKCTAVRKSAVKNLS